MKKVRSLSRKKQGQETTDFEIEDSRWTSLKTPAFQSDEAGTNEKGQSSFVLSNQPIEPGSGKGAAPGF